MGAPAGAVVGLYYDSPRLVAAGDALRTPTGRTYLVVSARVQEKGKHRGRQHLRCLVQTTPPEGAQVFPIYWYRRRRRAGDR